MLHSEESQLTTVESMDDSQIPKQLGQKLAEFENTISNLMDLCFQETISDTLKVILFVTFSHNFRIKKTS